MSSLDIWIDPLHGKEQPMGTAFICYSRKDFTHLKNTILFAFDNREIPYFLDKKDIVRGERWLGRIKLALNNSSCGVIVLTPQSINSPWIWFEAGILHGKDTPIIPFIINISDEEIEEFIKQLPPFISQIQVIKDVNELIDIVSGYTFKFMDVFPKDKEELNKRVLKKLKQVKLTFILKNVDKDLQYDLKFGYQIVRFGLWGIIQKEPHNLDLDETDRVHRIVYNEKFSYNETTNALKVEYILPVHNKWGLTFKLFLDVDDLKKIGDVKSLLDSNNFLDIAQSGSGEKQRIYFLIPAEFCAIVEEPYHKILNNYIYPV